LFVILLDVILLNVILLNVILLNVILLNVILLNVILSNVILSHVILQNFLLLNVMFPSSLVFDRYTCPYYLNKLLQQRVINGENRAKLACFKDEKFFIAILKQSVNESAKF
jgi:hypothetical protein